MAKYYRVGAFYRDENKKSVIVQCYDRKEAEEWIPRVKEMLYPMENSKDFRASIHEFKLKIKKNELNHYRITVERPVEHNFKDEWEECDYLSAESFDALVEAADEAEARAKFLNESFRLYTTDRAPEQYDIYIDEVPLCEVIKDEQKTLRHRLINKYLCNKYGDMPIRDFARLMQQSDENGDETFYETLKEHLKRLRLAEYLEKRLDASRLLHSEFTEILDGLCAASESESFEKINRAAVEKYGKEDDRK